MKSKKDLRREHREQYKRAHVEPDHAIEAKRKEVGRLLAGTGKPGPLTLHIWGTYLLLRAGYTPHGGIPKSDKQGRASARRARYNPDHAPGPDPTGAGYDAAAAKLTPQEKQERQNTARREKRRRARIKKIRDQHRKKDPTAKVEPKLGG
jgi:hypothetical protein